VFEWDPLKAAGNLAKHGVSFEEATTVFSDRDALDWEDLAHSQYEVRFKRVGRSITGRILMVIYTIRRDEHGKETIRIIGARQASQKERQVYAGPRH